MTIRVSTMPIIIDIYWTNNYSKIISPKFILIQDISPKPINEFINYTH